MSYLPCELHCHTIHSDGDFTVTGLQHAADDDHLAVIALTDHNTMSGYDETDSWIIPVIRGIEWTTYFGHMLVLGASDFVDWRDAVPDNIDEKIRQVKQTGALVGVAHPFQVGSPLCTGGRWQFNVRDWSQVDYIEIWHESISSGKAENDKALAFWTQLLDKGHKLACTYGRDWHRPTIKGHYCCTYLDLESVSAEAALNAIKLGRTVVSTGVKFFFHFEKDGESYSIGDTVGSGEYEFSFYLDLHAREKNAGEEVVRYKEIRLVSNGGEVVKTVGIDTLKMKAELNSGRWYRAELWGTVDCEMKLLAVTSPIYSD